MSLTNPYPPIKQSQVNAANESTVQNIQDITTDLTWVDMLKGIAIIGVFFDNWLGYFLHHNLISTTQETLYFITTVLKTAVGPFVQVFFILSGFGLAMAYFNRNQARWSWKHWAWRRITKIVFPYYIFVILSFALGMIGSALYETVNVKLSWASLIAYLTFTQNFYPPSWIWNPPLWYMPVLIGLYIIFPVLMIILKKWGPIKLLLVSIMITALSLVIAAFAGATGDHAQDLFLFWTVQFSMGIFLAYVRANHPEKLRLLVGGRAVFVGSALIFCSWVLRTYVPYGNVFNDMITSPGIFLLLLNLGWILRGISLTANTILISLSKQSYFMYLIHFPIMMFIIVPAIPIPLHPVIVFLMGGLYVIAIYFLCSFISKPINRFSSMLYKK